MTSRPSLLYTHQCLRKESFCVLSLSFVYVLCCTSPPLCRCTNKHTQNDTPLLLSPSNFPQSLTLFFFHLFVLAEQDLCRETPPPFHCDTGRSRGVSLSCTLYLFQSCFYHLGHHLSVNSAQLFPPQLIWNSNRHIVSLRSMKHVAILSKLSSDFGKKNTKLKKKLK